MSNNPIRADEHNALEQLREKLQSLKDKHDEMKAANRHFKANHTMAGYGNLTDAEAEAYDVRIKSRYSYERVPYPDWSLKNNYQNIRTTEQRVKQLEQEQNRGDTDYDTAHLGFSVEENKDIQRLQLFFGGKPDYATRELLKSNGFKWAPSHDCWQRLLNNNARYSLKRVIERMEKQYAGIKQSVAEME